MKRFDSNLWSKSLKCVYLIVSKGGCLGLKIIEINHMWSSSGELLKLKSTDRAYLIDAWRRSMNDVHQSKLKIFSPNFNESQVES